MLWEDLLLRFASTMIVGVRGDFRTEGANVSVMFTCWKVKVRGRVRGPVFLERCLVLCLGIPFMMFW